MRKPNVAKPRSASAAFSLSRKLPRLNLPRSVPPTAGPMRHPVVGKVARALPPSVAIAPVVAPCGRCGHGESHHPLRYVCDKYPHPDPLQLCGCEVAEREEICSRCSHKARNHKARHRCQAGPSCGCWGYEGV